MNTQEMQMALRGFVDGLGWKPPFIAMAIGEIAPKVDDQGVLIEKFRQAVAYVTMTPLEVIGILDGLQIPEDEEDCPVPGFVVMLLVRPGEMATYGRRTDIELLRQDAVTMAHRMHARESRQDKT